MAGTVERISISVDPTDRELIKNAAEHEGMTVSAWVAHAARQEARWAAARQFTDEFLNEGPPITEADEAWAEGVLGLHA